MIALIFIAAFVVYLAVSIAVIWLVVWRARKAGRSGWRWGLAAALCMYLLVFWDHIPTLILHKYYCATKAGFWVYKTPEQWKAENPGVAETLTWQELSPQFNNPDGSFGFKLNENIVDETRQWNSSIFPITISTDLLIDAKTGNILVKRVRVGSGYNKGQFYKFWVGTESCLPSQAEYGKLSVKFKQLGREIQ